MAATKELLTSSFLQRSPLFPPLSSQNLSFQSRQRSCVVTRRQSKSTVIATAVTENFIKVASKVAVEKPVKFKVRASVTVRRKAKEGLKETIGNQLDAFSDKIGRNIVLELVSNEIDQSKF